MPNYRLYRLDGAGKISSAEWIGATDDEDAVRQAQSLVQAGTCEIWDRDRLIARLKPEKDKR